MESILEEMTYFAVKFGFFVSHYFGFFNLDSAGDMQLRVSLKDLLEAKNKGINLCFYYFSF